MKNYKHLTSKEREKLSVLHAKNLSISEFARILKRSKSALLVIVDRMTRKTIIKKLERKTSSLTSSSIVSALHRYKVSNIHSITYDNGCEFANHELSLRENFNFSRKLWGTVSTRVVCQG